MIPSIGLGEIILILVVLLLVVDPRKLPEIARTIGRMVSRLKQASYEFKRALYLDEIRDEIYQPMKEWNPKKDVKEFVDDVAKQTFTLPEESDLSSSSSGSNSSISSLSPAANNPHAHDPHVNDPHEEVDPNDDPNHPDHYRVEEDEDEEETVPRQSPFIQMLSQSTRHDSSESLANDALAHPSSDRSTSDSPDASAQGSSEPHSVNLDSYKTDSPADDSAPKLSSNQSLSESTPSALPSEDPLSSPSSPGEST